MRVHVHHSDVNRVRKEIWRLALAEQDMQLIADACKTLSEVEYTPSRLVIETGLVVTYCRAFSGAPVDELAPESQLHTELKEIRDKLLAHSDRSYKSRREAVDVFGDHSHTAEYPPHLNPKLLDPICALALVLVERFKDAREEREQSLRNAGVEPEPDLS